MTDIIRVIRIISYEGPRDWVERTVVNSIHGERRVNDNCVIKAATLGTFPEILESKNVPHPDA